VHPSGETATQGEGEAFENNIRDTVLFALQEDLLDLFPEGGFPVPDNPLQIASVLVIEVLVAFAFELGEPCLVPLQPAFFQLDQNTRAGRKQVGFDVEVKGDSDVWFQQHVIAVIYQADVQSPAPVQRHPMLLGQVVVLVVVVVVDRQRDMQGLFWGLETVPVLKHSVAFIPYPVRVPGWFGSLLVKAGSLDIAARLVLDGMDSTGDILLMEFQQPDQPFLPKLPAGPFPGSTELCWHIIDTTRNGRKAQAVAQGCQRSIDPAGLTGLWIVQSSVKFAVEDHLIPMGPGMLANNLMEQFLEFPLGKYPLQIV